MLCTATVFLVRHACFKRKYYVVGTKFPRQNFVSDTVCALLLQTVVLIHYNIEMNQYLPRGRVRGHVAATVFLAWHACFKQKSYGVGTKFPRQNFVPATRGMKSAGLNSCIMKQGQNDLNFQCHIVCTALANCPCCNIEMNQYLLCVHQLAYCPCNMRPMRTREGSCSRFT